MLLQCLKNILEVKKEIWIKIILKIIKYKKEELESLLLNKIFLHYLLIL